MAYRKNNNYMGGHGMSEQIMTGQKFRPVTELLLHSLQTPEETRTWCPIGHGWLYDTAATELAAHGYQVRKEDLRVSKDNMEFFGILNIGSSDTRDWGLSIGLRNTHNKRASATILLGTNVWMCDNLCYSAEHTFTRKHHRDSYTVLASGIHNLMSNLQTYANEQREFRRRLRDLTLDPTVRHSTLIQAAQRGAILAGDILKVEEENCDPSNSNHEAVGTSAWALFNAATYVSKGYFEKNPETASTRSIALTKLFEEVVA